MRSQDYHSSNIPTKFIIVPWQYCPPPWNAQQLWAKICSPQPLLGTNPPQNYLLLKFPPSPHLQDAKYLPLCPPPRCQRRPPSLPARSTLKRCGARPGGGTRGGEGTVGGRGGYFIVSKCCPVNARIKTGKGGEGIVRMGGIVAVCRGTIAGGMGLGTRWSPRAHRGVFCGCTHVAIVP